MVLIKVASLFSGCGGTDLGIEGGFDFLGIHYKRHNTEIVYANDIEQSACEIFNHNFNVRCVNEDIRNIKASDIPNHDILTGGFPCQSFSIVAQNPPRLGYKDEKGKLFFEMVRILKKKQPKVFIAENVKGILSANKRKAFPLIIKNFEDAGYNVNWKLLNSADFGVPQRRERVFIVGVRKDLNYNICFPSGKYTNNHVPLKKILYSDFDIPEKYFFSDRAVQGLMNSNKAMNKGRAQDPEKPCNTVGAHLAKVSLNSTDPVMMTNGRYRRFLPREVARIQSFPDSFNLVGTDSSQYKALGNAIPPVFMWNIADAIIEQIFNRTYSLKEFSGQYEFVFEKEELFRTSVCSG
ncbi:MAG: DNA (cytosine-5-)-methyltransferase [Desulforegulaceae bacterium]|nr:DNA (cytosine-5-)-methyltransferase [Desulforegulaceae bacterium]